MIFCKNCGQGNPDDAAFCAQCGLSLEPSAQDTAPVNTGESEVTPGGPPSPPPTSPEEVKADPVQPPSPGFPGGPPSPPPGVPSAPVAGPPPVGPPGFPPPPGSGLGAPPLPQYVAPRPRNETEPMAIASLALAVAGWFFCPFLSILSLVFGYMARNKIQESGGRLQGDGLALAGIIVSWVLVGLTMLGIIIVIIGIAVGWWQTTSMLMPIQVAALAPLHAILLVA